ncbi:unnamed protein product [Chrysoparadoxa australica]
MASPSKRRDTDIMRLMMDPTLKVHVPDDSTMHDFMVLFPGPEETPYEGGQWKVHVALPKEYPYKSPSIGFENRLYHPNVDEMSGSVCLDVINQCWSPIFDLVNIFKLFLPQLLRYPNPADPLNGEAAALMMRDPEGYSQKIRECVRRYASKAIVLDDSDVKDNGRDYREGSLSSSTASSSPPSTISSASSDMTGVSKPICSGLSSHLSSSFQPDSRAKPACSRLAACPF